MEVGMTSLQENLKTSCCDAQSTSTKVYRLIYLAQVAIPDQKAKKHKTSPIDHIN